MVRSPPPALAVQRGGIRCVMTLKEVAQWRFLKNICGGNFLLCATNVPLEALTMVPVKTQCLKRLMLLCLLTNRYI